MIPVGDWSNDGHGKCDYFHATAAKPFKKVCQAFKAAKKLFKKEGFTPENICSGYQDNEVKKETITLLAKYGYKVNSEKFYTREMAELVVWFLNQGDPDLNAKLLSEDKKPPILRNWDYCKTMRDSNENLNSFGYGLHEN